MLIEFQVANYRSFKERQVLSMVASADRSLPANTFDVAGFGKRRLLKTAVVYGANASGKSNLINAIGFARAFIQSSANRRADAEIRVSPFQFAAETRSAPSEFEFNILIDGVRYQYGFAVDRRRVHREWLFAYPRGLPQKWFQRDSPSPDETEWSWGAHLKGDKQRLARLTRPDMLFLSQAANLEHEQLAHVHGWFGDELGVVDEGPNDAPMELFTSRVLMEDDHLQHGVADLLRLADLGIDGFSIKPVNRSDITFDAEMPEGLRNALAELVKQMEVVTDSSDPLRFNITMRHKLKGTDNDVYLDLDDESLGTRRLFTLSGPLFQTLHHGGPLVVDELDSSLHPILVRELIRMFHNPATNPNNAQLIFNTHDTTLLDLDLFRRDQIWFVEKDSAGASHLYQLLEFSPRKGEALQKGYLAGRYGAIPFIGTPAWGIGHNGE
ncbi:MAG: ATP-binding protein [Anaerolineae bacterium]